MALENKLREDPKADFVKEYKALLKKYNVELVEESFRDEWGNHESIFFMGEFSYSPDKRHIDRGFCGMGR